MGVVSKIVFKSKGIYDNNAKYEELDYVRYSGCLWGAKKETQGNTPPSTPEGTSEYWALLVRDGEYTGSMPTWNQIDDKPFSKIGGGFNVKDDGTLEVVFPTPPEQFITSTSNTFSVTDKKLDIKVDGNTVRKREDGTLYAEVTSAGFDINALPEVVELNATDSLPLYSTNAKGSRKTTWSNIVTKIMAKLSVVYEGATGSKILSSTRVLDSIDDINKNDTGYLVAGASAVKDIYKYVAPLPTQAPAFSGTENEYPKGSVVTYNGAVYYALVDIPKGSSWNSTKWKVWDNNIPIRFGIDADGNYGYYKAGADTVTPFKTKDTKPTPTSEMKLVRSTVATGVSSKKEYNIKTLFPDVDLTNVTSANFAILQTGTPSGNAEATYTAVTTQAVRATLESSKPSISYSGGTLTVTPPQMSAKANTLGTPSVATKSAYAQVTVYFYHIEKVES